MLIELDHPIPANGRVRGSEDISPGERHGERRASAGALYIGELVRKIISRIAQLRDQVRQAGGRVGQSSLTIWSPLRTSLWLWNIPTIVSIRPKWMPFWSRCNFVRAKVAWSWPASQTANCVRSAVIWFRVRDYHVYVPMNCTVP